MAMVNQSNVCHIRVIYIGLLWHVDVALNVSSQLGIHALGATFSSHLAVHQLIWN